MIIRPAQEKDAHGIARVHVDTWQSTYAGIVPQKFLDGLSHEARIGSWQEEIRKTPDQMCITVATTDDGEVIGFACGGPERTGEHGYPGELYAIYVLAAHQRKGIGQCLVKSVAHWLKMRGMTSLLVWVLIKNPARRFYELLGGQPEFEREIEIGGARLQGTGYGWREIDSLLKLSADCPPGNNLRPIKTSNPPTT
jgi:GNAT superfamily N-acetyltransferase